jgi:threonine aldolase
MQIRDFRSDTVTQPTARMRAAMAEALVGDDTLGEDKTVDELEEYSAKLLGKEAGLLVASGTMANQVAVQTLCQRGDEVLVGAETHIFNLEVGGLAALAQVQTKPLRSDRGYFNPHEVRDAIRKPSIQAPRTGLLCLENTYNLNGGIPLPADYMQEMADIAHAHDLPVYLDGARVFNAAVAFAVPPAALLRGVDAAMFCLTKGLAAPFGAVLVGSSEFVDKARWIKQRLGGGFRQIGHMAAAGLIGLQEMRARLADDHQNAKRLAEGLAAIDERLVDVGMTLTNVVHIDFAAAGKTGQQMVAGLLEFGVKVKPIGETECRMIAHHGLAAEDVDYAVEAIRKVLAE